MSDWTKRIGRFGHEWKMRRLSKSKAVSGKKKNSTVSVARRDNVSKMEVEKSQRPNRNYPSAPLVRDWQAESDLEVIKRAEEVKRSPERLRAAQKVALQKINEAEIAAYELSKAKLKH